MPMTGMESGVPSTGDFRRTPPEPREADSPERVLPSGRWVRRTASVASSSPPSRAWSTARTSRARRTCRRPGRSSSRATTCRSSTRSRSRSPPRGPCTSSRSRATSTAPGFSGWVSREFFTAIGAVPVQRGAGQAALDALDQQRQLLDAGQRGRPVPRGHPVTRRPPLQGPHRRGLPGPADRRARRAGRPHRHRQGHARRRDDSRRSRQRVTVKFGEPLDLAHHGPAESGKARRLATDDIMAAIHALSGQELANAYNEAPAHNPIERIRQVLPHERR